jgi:hypothetical protein
LVSIFSGKKCPKVGCRPPVTRQGDDTFHH